MTFIDREALEQADLADIIGHECGHLIAGPRVEGQRHRNAPIATNRKPTRLRRLGDSRRGRQTGACSDEAIAGCPCP